MIIQSRENDVATVLMNDPEHRNAFSMPMRIALLNAFRALEADQNVRAVVFTGGDKQFCVGGDITAMGNQPMGAALDRMRIVHDLVRLIAQSSKPFIAAINGFALGGGLELAMACHIRLASSTAKMGLPEVGLGVIPGYGGTQRLPRLVGNGRALQMIATAKMIDALTAERWGLVNSVHEGSDLLPQAMALGQQIAMQSGNAITEALAAVRAGWDNPVAGFAEEKKRFGACFQTPEFVEGTTAFLEKRKPQYS